MSLGVIYCAPCCATSALAIDPRTRTATTFGSVPAGEMKWGESVLAPDGVLYGVPGSATEVLAWVERFDR